MSAPDLIFMFSEYCLPWADLMILTTLLHTALLLHTAPDLPLMDVALGCAWAGTCLTVLLLMNCLCCYHTSVLSLHMRSL